jgi:inner membrane protein
MKTAFFNQQQTTMRFVIIGVIVLAMLIPLAMVEGVTEERQSFFDLTLADIANAWGNAQNVAGPFLIVPEIHRSPVENDQGEVVWHEVERERVYLPETLEIEVDVVHQYRRRAIYEVPVYSANILLRGGFPSLDPDVLNRSDVTVLPDRARIVMGVSHTQAISTASPLTTEDSAFEFHPGTGATWIGSGIHAPVEGHQGGAIQFEFELAMKGTRKLGFTPVGGSIFCRVGRA